MGTEASPEAFSDLGASVRTFCPHKAATPGNTHSSDHRVFGFKARKTFFFFCFQMSDKWRGSRKQRGVPASFVGHLDLRPSVWQRRG